MPTIDVALSTHAHLKAGVTTALVVRVILSDDLGLDPLDAELLAADMALTSRPGTMPTRITHCL